MEKVFAIISSLEGTSMIILAAVGALLIFNFGKTLAQQLILLVAMGVLIFVAWRIGILEGLISMIR